MNDFKIKEIAKAKGLTLEEVAQKIGITYSSLFRRLDNPKFETLKQVAEVLDVDVKELIQSTKETNTKPFYIENNGVYSIVGYIDMDKLK